MLLWHNLLPLPAPRTEITTFVGVEFHSVLVLVALLLALSALAVWAVLGVLAVLVLLITQLAT